MVRHAVVPSHPSCCSTMGWLGSWGSVKSATVWGGAGMPAWNACSGGQGKAHLATENCTDARKRHNARVWRAGRTAEVLGAAQPGPLHWAATGMVLRLVEPACAGAEVGRAVEGGCKQRWEGEQVAGGVGKVVGT
jgi:hypothetical protein